MQWEEVVTTDPETMGGVPGLPRPRVAIKSPIQHFSAGDSLDDFLEGFPGVSREQATAFLQFALDAVVSKITKPGQLEHVGP